MKKDKEWLKNKTYNLSNAVMNLDGNIQYVVSKIAVLDLIDKSDEPELPAVPRFVSDFIDEIKPNFNISTVFSIKNHKHKKAQNWAFDNSDLFARAWTVGCTIEEELRWVVYESTGYLSRMELSAENVLSHKTTINKFEALKFGDKQRADAVALMFNGEVEEVTE